jgi:hypothetical protein
MWAFIGALAARLAMIRWLLKVLGGLGVLLPIAFLLKVIGLPILAVLAVLAAPVLFVLFLFGLPIFLVLLVGGAIMGVVFSVLTAGLVVLKIAIVIVLPIWLLCKLTKWLWRDRGTNGAAPDAGAST